MNKECETYEWERLWSILSFYLTSYLVGVRTNREKFGILCIRQHLVTKVQEGDIGQYSAKFGNLYVVPLFSTDENFDSDSVG
jgi:hypothetical protein